jgi:hypothetical protein
MTKKDYVKLAAIVKRWLRPALNDSAPPADSRRKTDTMKISCDGNTGYALWLSARDTRTWANKPGARWPCSFLAGRRLVVRVDIDGLYGIDIDGGRGDQDCPADELAAIVVDHLPADLRHLWPCRDNAPAVQRVVRF